jgi:hypothetical protein
MFRFYWKKRGEGRRPRLTTIPEQNGDIHMGVVNRALDKDL